MGFYQFKREQLVHSSIDELWSFISSPQNLKNITPEYMGFDILTENLPEKIYEGMIINYSVKPILRIATNWVTEITHVKDKSYFVDEQRVGPYFLWHHQHIINQADNGVLMTDIVSYKPPYGIIGSLANFFFIKNKLIEIFDYRTTALEKIF